MESTGATLKPLLNASVGEYAEGLTSQFMGIDVLPAMEVSTKTGTYGVVPVENVTDETGDGKRAPRGAYQRNDSSVETAEWACTEYGLEEPLDDSENRDISEEYRWDGRNIERDVLDDIRSPQRVFVAYLIFALVVAVVLAALAL